MDLNDSPLARFLPKPQGYTVVDGNVRYLDAAPLRRPFDMPPLQKMIAAAFVFAAVVISAYLVNSFVAEPMRQASLAQESVEASLAREPSVASLPALADYALLDDDEIKAALDEAGLVYYDATELSQDGTLLLYKLPSDVDLKTATTLYLRGMASWNASQAARMMNGSWSLNVERDGAVSLVVRYVDFASGTVEGAVAAAVQAEGFDVSSITGSDVDDAGNTYSEGTVDSGGTEFQWRVSAILLSNVRSISGLPSNAVYVGIRLTEL